MTEHKVILITSKELIFDSTWMEKYSRSMCIINERTIVYSSGRGGHIRPQDRSSFNPKFPKENTVLLEK